MELRGAKKDPAELDEGLEELGENLGSWRRGKKIEVSAFVFKKF